MSTPVRESYLFLPWYAPAILYTAFLVSGLIMLYGLHRHLRSYGIGVREFASILSRDLGSRVRRFSRFGLGQGRVLRGGGSGSVMHASIFYGFLMLLAYTTLIFLQDDILKPLLGVVYLQGGFYLALELLADVMGTAFLVGFVIAVYRRYVKRLEKLETRLDDGVVLTMLIWIGVSGFFLEAFRLVAIPTVWAPYSPVGDALSWAVGSLPLARLDAPTIYQWLWWAHMFSVFALIAATPYTKLVHVFTSGFNVALAPQKPMGRLSTPFSLAKMLESGTLEEIRNTRSARDLSPLQLLALDACTNCGRCQEVCPAYASGRDLSPRLVVQDLGRSNREGVDDVIAGGVLREDELWSCTTCNACVSACPVFINQVDYIVEFRRSLVASNRLDQRKSSFLESVGRSGNPFGLPQSERQTWLAEMGVPTVKEKPDAEYLYWVGCQSSYDPRGRGVAKAMIKILREAGVSFAVLGNEEVCTGEPVRRLGEEARFQELALKNIESIKRSGAKKVLVNCAHCFNTFLNEYPELGADFVVVHHSQLIAELLSAGRIKPGRGGQKLTFHDPCNLGRINGIVDEPRGALGAVSASLLEMKRSGVKSFCCGGGGANAWYEVPEKKKIGVIRVEEARSTGADAVAVACPFCITMFEDATKAIGDEAFQVRDIAEVVAEQLPG